MIKIHPIFEKSSSCKLWTVKYDTEEKDVFHKLFDQWNDTGYLANFFTENQALLQDPFWKNITIDEAIDQVLEEAEAFEDELFDIKDSDENKQIEALGAIFKPLHKTLFEIKRRKGKPDFATPMLRLYAIKIDDGSIVITGGAIKLTKMMEGPMFDKEIQNLKIVQQYLESEDVSFSEGLNDL